MMKRFVSVFLLFAGCSNDLEPNGLDLAHDYFSSEAYVSPQRFVTLLSEPRTVLDVEFIDLGVAGKLVLEQQDGPFSRYLSADLGGIILQNGMLHSIYGFGETLVGSDLSEPLALVLAGRAGQADRFHTYVNGEDRAVSRTFRCEIGIVGPRTVDLITGSVATTLMSENCQNLTSSFDSLYWVDRNSGEIIQSRQWVGDNIGSFVTRVTLP